MVNTHLKIVTSTRLVRIPANYIVYIKARANYCDIYLLGNQQGKDNIITVTWQLGQIITMIQEQLPDFTYMFARVGKSLVVNANYIVDIDLISKIMILVDHKFNKYDVKASRDALKQIKEQLEQREKILEQRKQQKSL